MYFHICPFCGKKFYGGRHRVYCSDDCKSKSRNPFSLYKEQAEKDREERENRLAARDAEWDALARENGIAPRIEERDGKVIEIRGQGRIAPWGP